jgi:iron complex outermembrane receptor protein
MKKILRLTSLVAALAMSCHLQAATVSGVVTDTNGKPIEGAIVTAKGNSARAVTDEDGRYILENLLDGHVHIHITSSRHIHGDKEFDDFSGSQTADFVLKGSSIENIVVTANSLQTLCKAQFWNQ